jgi:hypothetical protein
MLEGAEDKSHNIQERHHYVRGCIPAPYPQCQGSRQQLQIYSKGRLELSQAHLFVISGSKARSATLMGLKYFEENADSVMKIALPTYFMPFVMRVAQARLHLSLNKIEQMEAYQQLVAAQMLVRA